MKLTVQIHLEPEERHLLRQAMSPFRELPHDRHWDGALSVMHADAPLTRETLEHMLSVARELATIESEEINLELTEEAIEFLSKVLSLLDRCSSYTRKETDALVQDLLPLELDLVPSGRVAP